MLLEDGLNESEDELEIGDESDVEEEDQIENREESSDSEQSDEECDVEESNSETYTAYRRKNGKVIDSMLWKKKHHFQREESWANKIY